MHWKFLSVAEMKAIEAEANEKGKSYPEMMEAAGAGLAGVVFTAHSQKGALQIVGLVGSGANGGDTLIALAHLAHDGFSCCAYLAKPRPADEDLVDRLVEQGGQTILRQEDPGGARLRAALLTADILLDGLLGTGFKFPISTEYREILAETKQALEENQAPVCIYAVDCPSGVDCDSGEMDENSLTATVTVCMEAVKVGLLKMPAFSKVGRLEVVSLELSPDLPSLVRVKNRVTSPAGVMETIPQRRLDAHKGTFGTAVIAAGSDRYPGAAMLAGKAAYRVGVGLVSMAVPDVLHGALAGNFLEATWILLPSEMGGISANAAAILHESMDRATALLVGPGWGTQDTTVRFLQRFLSQSSPTTPQKWELLPRERVAPASAPVPIPPLVIDADGLRALAKIENWVDLLPKETILTPHPGEMAGLTGLSTSEIQADRLGIARRYAQEWNCIVVLKGAFTVVAAPDGTTLTNPVATPALARAGSGDVLAGMITGFLAQGMLPLNAAVAGVWLHGQCGLAAEQSLGGSASVLAGDLVDQIAWVLSRLSS